ncbi:MAG: DUF4157 domain-containing protein [Actinobacteria bacterium]|nr:DUF4157 domain-containing protein [Actinomycetota bacterium]
MLDRAGEARQPEADQGRPATTAHGGSRAQAGTASLLRLQRLAGNAAVAALCSPPGGSTTRPLPAPPARKAAEVPSSVLAALPGLGAEILRSAANPDPPTAPAFGGIGAGEPLAAEVRRPYELSFGYNLSHVRLHSGAPAQRVLSHANAAALSVGDHIFFGSTPCLQREADRRLLGHELAHTVQSRLGGAALGRVSDPSWSSEREAEQAALAAHAGRAYRLTMGAGDDPHRIAPWLILAGIGLAAGLITWAVSDSPEENAARHQQGQPDRSSEVWALIPVYGSIQQIREAESYFQRVVGVGFLMLDMATLGTAGIAARALLKAPGALIRTAVTRRGAALAVREGGEIATETAARDAAATVTRQGGRVMASEAQASAEMLAALERGSMVAIFEGGLNHAAIVARNGAGELVKLHGGPLRVLFATTGREMTPRAVSSVARRVNAYAIVEAGETAVDLERATAAVQRGGPAAVRWLGGNPTSCGLVQGALLEASNLPAATLTRLVPQGGAAARMLPITIMDHMAGQGALRLVEGGVGRIVGGTVLQGSLLTVGAAAPPLASSVVRIMVTSTLEPHAASGLPGTGGHASESGSAAPTPERTEDSDDAAFRITSNYGRSPDGLTIERIRSELPSFYPGWFVMSDSARRSLVPSLVSAGMARSTAERIAS